eukprot:463170-Amorphochlora_amoeboformis.AAC.1
MGPTLLPTALRSDTDPSTTHERNPNNPTQAIIDAEAISYLVPVGLSGVLRDSGSTRESGIS